MKFLKNLLFLSILTPMFMGCSFDKISVNGIQRIESDFKNVDEYIKNKYRLYKQPQADFGNFAKYNKIKIPLPIDKNEEGVFYLKDGSKIEYRYSLKDKRVYNESVYPVNNIMPVFVKTT
jgi:hypothetical protein